MTDNPMRALFDDLVADPSVENIIGTYTDADGNLVVLVLDDSPEAIAPWVSRAEGVKFVKSPPFVAYDDAKRYRPFPGGCSVGSYRISAGTLSLVVRDKTDQSLAVLSNNHVLANVDQCAVGDDILQPGAADGGQRAGDTIADLTRWIPMRGSGTKRVDCAIAKIKNEADARLDILGIGYCYGISDPFIDQKIWKYGRTTERTRRKVIATIAVVQVGYSPTLTITIHDCII